MNDDRLLRVTGVMERLGVSKSQVWHLTKINAIKSYSLSPRVTVWKLSEIEAYISLKCGEVA